MHIAAALTAIVFLASLACAVPAGAQEPSAEEKARVQQEMMAAMQPGPEHDRLAAWAGEWMLELRMWPAPGAEPMVASGSAVNRMILGNRFLEIRSEGGEGPMRVEALSLLGFDRRKHEFTVVGFDTWGTYYVTAAGVADSTGRLVLDGTMDEPISGRRETYQMIFRPVDADTFVHEVLFSDPVHTRGGEPFKMVEITFHRRTRSSAMPESRSIEKTVTVAATPDAVWRALTEARELERWFPLSADVTPGVGGRISLSWGPGSEGTSDIEIWEPGRRLLASTTFPGEPGAPPVRVAVDYRIEAGAGGTTVLRLVHSGFSADASWDEMYDAIDGGWTYFLYNLRHYLEVHPGTPRTMVWERRPMTRPRAEVWRDLATALGDPPGLPFAGSAARNEVVLSGAPDQIAVRMPELDESLLFIELEQGGEQWNLGVWLSTYGIPAERTAELQAELGRWLDAAVGG